MYEKSTQGWLKHIDFILLDVLSLVLAFFLALFVRYGFSNPFRYDIYIDILFLYAFIDFIVLICNNSMSNVLKRGYYIELVISVKHVFLVEVITVFFLFTIKKGEQYSRIVVYLFALFYLVITYLVRLGWKAYLCKRKASVGAASVYIITTEEKAEKEVTDFLEAAHGKYIVSGICVADKNLSGQRIKGIPVTSNFDTVAEYLCRQWVDEVFVMLPPSEKKTVELVDKLTEMGIVVHMDFMDYYCFSGSTQFAEKIQGHPVLTICIKCATRKQIILKRMVDIAAGLAGCLVTLVLTVILGPMIYIASPGPIFFSQTRIGRNGKKFKIYKFRSMYPDAEQRKAELMEKNRVKDGMMFKLDYDPRIIGCRLRPDGTVKKGIGNYIRDWSLDEFPQFFNVLSGTMSLCGTRPPTEDEWEKYELHHRARLAIKPGITGLWQVSGRSNITSFDEVVELDKQYIRNWSMGLDFKIMLKTLVVVFKKDGAM
ncbi:MAG: sugar transferase [Lachnospiraceae bacterium]